VILVTLYVNVLVPEFGAGGGTGGGSGGGVGGGGDLGGHVGTAADVGLCKIAAACLSCGMLVVSERLLLLHGWVTI
jgi:hypothetical protein